MPNLVNRLLSSEYDGVLGKSEGVIILTMGGIGVHELERIRGELAKEKVRLRMVRNSLLRRAMAERGFEATPAMLAGNIGVAVGTLEGAIHAAKVLTSPEIKKAGKLQLRGAIFDGALLGPADAVLLAGLPDKRTLRGMLVGCIQGPLRGLAALLNALPSSTARVIQAHADSQPQPSEGDNPAPAA
jgi:large subunit ribosomal protein L10